QAGMGTDAVDYDGDGWLDIIKTNFSDDTATLYHNNHDGSFTDVTASAGLARNSQFLGWGTLFVDVDNDGWPDILMANGHVYPELDSKGVGLNSTFRERKLLYWNDHQGRFRDISLDRESQLHSTVTEWLLQISIMTDRSKLSSTIVTTLPAC